MRWFDRFHQLSDEQAIEIPSDDDKVQEILVIEIDSDTSEEDIQPSAPKPPNSPPSPAANEAIRNATHEFKNHLGQLVPVRLVPEDLLQRILNNSQQLLRDAIEVDADIADVYIDQCCLLSWPGRIWDPETESLHSVLQSRLGEYSASTELSTMIRDSVVTLGNQRLDDARKLGVPLGHLYIGHDLLPAWLPERKTPDSEASQRVRGEDFGISPPSEDVDGDDQFGVDVVMTDVDTMDAVRPGVTEEVPCRTPSLFSLDDSDSDSESDYDDVVSLHNFVEGSPSLDHLGSDDSDEPPNVVHDLDIITAEGQLPHDFELYLAQEDEDLDDLLEVEMAIDNDGFEAHYHDGDDGVDMEIADTEFFCSVPADIDDNCVPDPTEWMVI